MASKANNTAEGSGVRVLILTVIFLNFFTFFLFFRFLVNFSIFFQKNYGQKVSIVGHTLRYCPKFFQKSEIFDFFVRVTFTKFSDFGPKFQNIKNLKIFILSTTFFIFFKKNSP